MNKFRYRIQRNNGTFINVGTNLSSWFFLEEARKLVNRDKGQRIIEHNGLNILWEVF